MNMSEVRSQYQEDDDNAPEDVLCVRLRMGFHSEASDRTDSGTSIYPYSRRQSGKDDLSWSLQINTSRCNPG